MNTFFFDDVQYPEGLFGGKDFFNPIIYSTEEREVGVWIDNKPLYAKSFTLSSQITVSASSLTNTDLSLSDVEKFVNGYAISDDGTFQGSVVVDKSNDVIQLQSTRSSASYVKYLTVFYTKTTDTAGSGSYTTLGVPAVHYTTDEQVIGTWLGETLYRKIVSFDNVTINANGFASYQLSQYINNLSHAIFHKTVAITTGGYSELPSVHVGEISGYAWSSALNDNELYISRANASGVTADYRVVVEYTKTS